MLTSEDAVVVLSDGLFEGNDAFDGGVVFIAEDAGICVKGGFFFKNVARNSGGVFWAEDGGDLEVSISDFLYS